MVSKFGTREWAEVNKNLYVGCEHNCRYCYARYNALIRFKKIRSAEEWKIPRLIEKALNEKPRLYKGRIMYPTQHDILPDQIDVHVNYLRKWLEMGNSILIVSKPHYKCIERICDELEQYRSQIVFRFTIGSKNDAVLKFWEPGAPSYEERLSSLIYAFLNGFKTSVSCEPLLDTDSSFVYELLPYMGDTLWLGKMNFIIPRVDTKGWTEKDFGYLDEVKQACSDEYIKGLYAEFKDVPRIKWKESIKKVIGLPDEDGVA
jgi:hypothetical protein